MGFKAFETEKYPQFFNEDYDVIGILGKGGMGTVYKAVQKNMNREVALKVLEAGIGTDSDESVKRFNLEVQAMKKLDHQNLVQVFDFGREGSQLYIAMTYVPGINLSELLRRRKHLELEEVVLLVKQIARGLLYAHQKGIVHRDIKPSNIIISPDNNRVYITDFGISQIQDHDRLTSTGTAMGTPEYMSPEQCQGEEVTQQSDIYSLGIIFYEMLTGDPPFTGSKPLDIAYKQVHSQPEPLSTKCRNIPPDLENLILRCLRKNRSERIQNAPQFLEDLDKVMQPLQTAENSTSAQPTKKSTRKIPSMVTQKSPQGLLLPLAFGLIALLTLLQVLLVLLQREEKGVHILDEFQISAPWEQRALESDAPNGYPLSNLLDNNLQSAWLLPAVDIDQNPVLVIRFPKPTLITNIGLAIGYQKAKDDQLQDRFAMFQKPQDLIIKTVEGSVQKVSLQNVHGMQYLNANPVETSELRIEFRSVIPGTSPGTDLAISELRLLGLELPEPEKK